MTLSTSQFYEQNASEYFDRTVNANMSHLYPHFLELIPIGGSILDAGCGSGRDLLEFSKNGFEVLGIDASEALVELAKHYSGAPCIVKRLEDIDFDTRFDGVWACASLLHLERNILPDVLIKIRNALVSGGILFVSVREGEGIRTGNDGRFYTLFGLQEFSDLLRSAGFIIKDNWTSEDVLSGREKLTWINFLAQKPD